MLRAADLHIGPFPGVFFPPQQHGGNPWQQSPGPVSGPGQPNLGAAVESFYKAGGPPFGAFSQPPSSSQPQQPGLQFGAFASHNFPQFGQLGTGFGHAAPFIHTGARPQPIRNQTCCAQLVAVWTVLW